MADHVPHAAAERAPADTDTIPALLHVDGLSRRYGDFWALRHASFSVRAGEILGLIGPNGSGKTTLFQCLAGVSPATSGIVMAGRTVLDADHRADVLYYVPDGIRPWPDQTLEWTMRLMAELSGRSASEREEAVRVLGLGALLDTRLRELSKGEHKRALLAIGLLSRQRILMLDEPFDGLDLRQSREVMPVLREQVARGRTLFLSIHQLTDAERVCDRLVLLSDGRVVAQGTAHELRAIAGVEGEQASLEEVFLALT